MSHSQPPKDDPPHPHSASSQEAKVIQKARTLLQNSRDVRAHLHQTLENARETRARLHQTMEATRRVVQARDEIGQQVRAGRERLAEHNLSLATPSLQPAVHVLLIEEDMADIVCFRLALGEYDPSWQVMHLIEREEVEAFGRQAATLAPLFRPRLIIMDGEMSGIESAEIVASLRRVPAYHGIPLLLFSSLEEAEGRERCRQWGATAFVHKPRTWEAFVSAVAVMMQSWGGGSNGQIPPRARKERGAVEDDED